MIMKDKYEQCLKVLHTALCEDKANMKIIVKVKENEYELDDILFEQFVDENANIQTIITIKV